MPNIAEYSATGEITPSDKGIQAAEVAARRTGEFFHQIQGDIKSLTGEIAAKVEKHDELLDISNTSRHMSDLELNATTALNKGLADNPNDPGFLTKHLEDVTKSIDGITALAKTDRGKMFATERGDELYRSQLRETHAAYAHITMNTVADNVTQTTNNAVATVAQEPSPTVVTAQLDRATANIHASYKALKALPGANIGALDEEEIKQVNEASAGVYKAYYRSGTDMAVQDIANHGGDASKSQVYADLKAHMDGDTDAPKYLGEDMLKFREQLNEAPKKGLELYKSGAETVKAQAIEQGKAGYAQIDTSITVAIANGQPLNPEQITAIDRYAQAYGATNPGEVHALNDARIRAQESAQNEKVQPYNPKVWDDIHARIGLAKGDPRAVTASGLLQAWGSHQITTEQLKLGQELVKNQDSNPGFKAAQSAFARWQAEQSQFIGSKALPGTGAARAQFIHDSDVIFMDTFRATGDPEKALKAVTDIHNPVGGNMAAMVKTYNHAAQKPDAAGYIQKFMPHFNDDGSVTSALGSHANPVYPTAKSGLAPAQPVKVDQAAVDKAIWGH